MNYNEDLKIDDLFEEEPQDLKHNIVDDIIDSLKERKVDYCFFDKVKDEIELRARENNITACYKKVVDKYGNLDYYEIVPMDMYKNKDGKEVKLSKGFYNIISVPKYLKCVVTCKRRPKVIKNYNAPMFSYIVDENTQCISRVMTNIAIS